MSKLQHEVAALKKQPKPPAAAETPEKLTSRRTSARCSTTAAGSSSTPRGVSEDGGNRGLNTSGEISARRTTSRSASRLRNRDARQPAAAGTRSTTLPSQVLRCQHAFAAGEKPRCLSHGTARAASVLLKVVAALLDNLKVVLSPSYVPSRKFKEAAAHAPPTPALCGSELPRHWKERMCRV